MPDGLASWDSTSRSTSALLSFSVVGKLSCLERRSMVGSGSIDSADRMALVGRDSESKDRGLDSFCGSDDSPAEDGA